MTVNDIIKQFPAVLTSKFPRNVRKTIQFNIGNPVFVVLDHGQCSVHDGITAAYDVAINVKDELLLAMFEGELSGSIAYMTGRFNIDGDFLLARMLPSFFDLKRILKGECFAEAGCC